MENSKYLFGSFISVILVLIPVTISAQYFEPQALEQSLSSTQTTLSTSLISANFDGGSDGFAYVDDAFNGTNQPMYANGTYSATGGYSGGCLKITLGGVDNNSITNMSGGWQRTFMVSGDQAGVVLSIRYTLSQTGYYESDEYGRMLVMVDGKLFGRGSKTFVDHIGGDGEKTVAARTTEWMLYDVFLGTLASGEHTITLGGFNSKKDNANESTTILIDNFSLSADNSAPAQKQTKQLVDRLDINTFKSTIQTLSGFGDRCQMAGYSLTSFNNAQSWVVANLQSMGYTVQYNSYTYNSTTRNNIYVTKVGKLRPDQMYMVSAHLDGRGGGGGADDDASGCALVLEAARVFATADVETDISVRFIFWGNEETGLNGSAAYCSGRRSLQGKENPVGSGIYPEPTWLGIITHDMILYDHGNPAQTSQIPGADIDIEYRATSTYAAASKNLALSFKSGNGPYASQYPAELGDSSRNTDDYSFRSYTAAISIRENRRCNELEGVHPYYHTANDLFAKYSSEDMEFGFNTVQTSVGAIGDLVNVKVGPQPNRPPVANAKQVTTPCNTPITITFSGSDPDKDSLIYTITRQPLYGTLGGMVPVVTYTPSQNYSGTDTFAFIAIDDSGATSEPALVIITIQPPGPVTVFLDDFETDKHWVRNPSGTDNATVGLWERGHPQATTYQLSTTPSGSNCLVTGAAAGSTYSDYDVDGGVTSIRSPAITLPSSGVFTLKFNYYMSHANNSSSSDYLRVKIIGSSTVKVFEELGAANTDYPVWASFSTQLTGFSGQTVYIQIEAADLATGSIVEASVDDVLIAAQ